MKTKKIEDRKWIENMMDDWLKELPKICTHCGSQNGHKFLQMSNNKTSQPRYNCKSCKTNFTHNGKSHQIKAKQSVSPTLMKKSTIKKAKLNAIQIHPNKVVAPLIVRPCWQYLPSVYIEGWKEMTEVERIIADETRKDYCYVKEYFDDSSEDGREVEEFVSIEYEDEL
jgi:hypothetical protein